MLGNPLVQFCEGQGGNEAMVLCHPQPETLSTRPNSHEIDVLIRVTSCDFVDRSSASIAAHHSFNNLLRNGARKSKSTLPAKDCC